MLQAATTPAKERRGGLLRPRLSLQRWRKQNGDYGADQRHANSEQDEHLGLDELVIVRPSLAALAICVIGSTQLVADHRRF